ncbi:hypothetical protein SK128_002108, partial [Halocaridina rubra]
MDNDDKACLDCPICMEQYNTQQRTPKMMPCLHSVCAHCLFDIATAATPPDKKSVEDTNTVQNSETSITSMANQSAEDENSKNKSRGYLNSEAISNVASTLIWRSCTLPRPASWNIQSMEDQPPPIPSRNQRRTAPPLRPKSTSVLKHRSFLGMREPEIPRNIVFQCPICRTSVDSSKLQTNRYVIAHLKDLQRFKREHEPSSPVCRNAPLDQSREYVENAMIYIPENNWCNTCVKPCSADCSNHSYKPLHE